MTEPSPENPQQAPDADRHAALRQAARRSYRLPLIGYPLAWLATLLRLPRRMEALQAASDGATDRLERSEKRLDETAAALARASETLAALAEDLAQERRAREALREGDIADLEGALDRLIGRVNEQRLVLDHYLRQRDSAATSGGGTPAPDDSAMEALLTGLEDRYRGSPETIRQRLSGYLPLMGQAAQRTGELPVLDLGCGRGDWLAALRDAGIAASGLDSSDSALAEAHAAGLDAVRGDAVEHLSSLKDASLAAVTAIHLAEHLPFPRLRRLVAESFRVLAPGGVILLETPNPANLVVGAHTFWIDPTHRAPLAPELLSFLVESCGFGDVALRYSTPDDRADEPDFVGDRQDPLRHLTRERLMGPYDYAVIGIRPHA